MTRGKETEENDQLNDESSEPMRVSHMQASNTVVVLMRYFKQIDFAMADDVHPLSLSIV